MELSQKTIRERQEISLRKRTIVATILAAVLLLSFSVPVFAAQTSQSGPAQSVVQKHGPKAGKGKLKPVRQLQKRLQAKRHNLLQERKTLNRLLKRARKEKNDGAVNQIQTQINSIKTDLAGIKQLNQHNKSAWQQVKTFRQKKDFQGAAGVLKQIAASLRSQLKTDSQAVKEIHQAIVSLRTALGSKKAQATAS